MPKAKYEGIYRSIKKRIEAQDYPYQSLLPSENTLIEEYDCSRNTVRRAIAELIADGYVQAMQGRGVRVIYQPVGKTTFTIGGIETFQETANRNHLQAVTRVIRFETITATEQFAAESGFSEGDELWAVQRVRYLDGKALILDINYFLKEFVPGLTEEIASHSIYDFIENVLGMQIITSKRRITVEHATVRDEKLLDMDGYDCVAVVVNQTFNSDGLLFEYTQSRHQPDYFCFQDIATRKKIKQSAPCWTHPAKIHIRQRYEKQSVPDCWVSVKQFSKNDTATACQDWLRSTRLGRGSIKSHVRTVKVLGMGLFAFQERIHLWKGVTH